MHSTLVFSVLFTLAAGQGHMTSAIAPSSIGITGGGDDPNVVISNLGDEGLQILGYAYTTQDPPSPDGPFTNLTTTDDGVTALDQNGAITTSDLPAIGSVINTGAASGFNLNFNDANNAGGVFTILVIFTTQGIVLLPLYLPNILANLLPNGNSGAAASSSAAAASAAASSSRAAASAAASSSRAAASAAASSSRAAASRSASASAASASAAAAASTLATSTVTVVPPPGPTIPTHNVNAACPADNSTFYLTNNGMIFLVECYTDHYGGDFATGTASTLSDAIEQCSLTTNCVALSWVEGPGGPNYMKNVIQPAVSASNIWGASLKSS